jgi:uncharacterized protein YndB with AHSA1/START domain
MAQAQKPSLTIKRKLKAPPRLVFSAWTEPERLVHWFGPAPTILGSVKADLDVRVGGNFRVSFSTEDGEYHEVGGTYREVVPDEKLVFSWAWHTTPDRESLVTVSLKADAGGTLLTLHHEQFFDQKARDGHEYGWTGTMDKLEAYVAKQAAG